jgi:transcriptional regulator with GAF, ATPase, and Fis domain
MERAGWMQAKAARLLGLDARQIGYARWRVASGAGLEP